MATPHIMIVEARFYPDIADHLFDGARRVLDDADASYDRFEVPGAFEIPAAIKYAIRSRHFLNVRRRYDGYVALGSVIRGETTHYDYVCAESARGLMRLATEYTLALGYGILTCESREQALERARVDGKDKGGDAARTCLAMLRIKERFKLWPRPL